MHRKGKSGKEHKDVFIRNQIQSTQFYQIPTMSETKITFQKVVSRSKYWHIRTGFLLDLFSGSWHYTKLILVIYIDSLRSDVLDCFISSSLGTSLSDLIDSFPAKRSRARYQVNEIFVVIASTYIFLLKNVWVLNNHIDLYSLSNHGKILKLFLVSTLSVQSLLVSVPFL